MEQGSDTQPVASPGEALEHHGIKGMKWGVRKREDTSPREAVTRNEVQKNKMTDALATPKSTAPKPVAPLSERKQASVKKHLERADIMQTRVSELKVQNEALAGTRNLSKLYQRKANNDLIKQTERQRKQAVRDAEAIQKGKLTRKQKQVIAGAVVVTAIVGYTVYSRGQQSGALNSWKLMGQARLRGQKIPFNVNKELSGKMSARDILAKVAKPVNPNYSKPGGQMNCRRSTYAFELRRRGFDVHATTSAVGWGQSESGVINALTTEGKDYFRATSMSRTVVDTGFSSVASGDKRKVPGAKILLDNLKISDTDLVSQILGNIKSGKGASGTTASSSKKIFEELATHPNGSRGEVLFKFPGFGHSMAYEVVNGVPKIFDSQKGTMYDATKLVESKWDGFSAAEIRRLDNVDLDYNFLTRWATNA